MLGSGGGGEPFRRPDRLRDAQMVNHSVARRPESKVPHRHFCYTVYLHSYTLPGANPRTGTGSGGPREETKTVLSSGSCRLREVGRSFCRSETLTVFTRFIQHLPDIYTTHSSSWDGWVPPHCPHVWTRVCVCRYG